MASNFHCFNYLIARISASIATETSANRRLLRTMQIKTMLYRTLAASLFILGVFSIDAHAREWTDSSGHYTIEAELIGFSDGVVVLKREDHELVAIPMEVLSREDQEFLKSEDALEVNRKHAEGMQTWTLKDGTELVGRVVDYSHREVTLQRRRGRIYVNDRNFDNLPTFYQTIIPQMVAETEDLRRSDRRALESWLVRQRAQPRSFMVDGVVLEVENGDEYVVPFSLFSEEDQSVLLPGWKDWLAATNESQWDLQASHAFLLKSLAAARHQDNLVNRQIAELKLQLHAVQAGLTSLWEVTLYPTTGQSGPPLWVVVPGRDSRQASATAMEKYPGHAVGPVRRLTRR